MLAQRKPRRLLPPRLKPLAGLSIGTPVPHDLEIRPQMINPNQEAALAAIGLSPAMRRHIEQFNSSHGDLPSGPPPQAPFLMRLVELQRDALTLHDGWQTHLARALPALHGNFNADPKHDALAVGDWVYASRDAHAQWWVHACVPSMTQLARRHHDGRDKITRAVIVSNVDTALLVMGLDHDFSLRRLERYLALARMSEVQPVVVLSKADLCEPELSQRRLQEVCALLPAGVQALALDLRHTAACQVLAPWTLPGQTLVLLGSSGAGKSTLSNTLIGHGVQDTGPNRAGDSRGRHTTTSRSLHPLPGGACLIDTPGLRTLRLDADAQTLGSVFEDITQGAMQCRFRNCSHGDEPGCVVREQVAPERLRNYQKLQREAQRDSLSLLQKREQLRQWKLRSRAHRARERLERES